MKGVNKETTDWHTEWRKSLSYGWYTYYKKEKKIIRVESLLKKGKMKGLKGN